MTVSLRELAQAAGAATPREDCAIVGIEADSRAIKPGYLFAAIPGTQIDGARFIGDAKANGAAAVLVADDVPHEHCLGLPYIKAKNPRLALALMARCLFGTQPACCVAVTGTNGKSSIVSFVQQIWRYMGLAGASMGTVGIEAEGFTSKLAHTTPDPITFHRTLAELGGQGITHLALEASSHGLQQHRLDGIHLTAAAFTNITRDHLDYHDTFDEYLDAKMGLFERLMPKGAPAIVNADILESDKIIARCKDAGLDVLSVGERGEFLELLKSEPEGFSQRLSLKIGPQVHDVTLPLAGDFQAMNAITAAALVMAAGGETTEVLAGVAGLKGAPGRLELVETSITGAPVFVDYAHTPDALKTALKALKPFARQKLHVVFGCGGDRDKGKRPQMGAIATALADYVYVTDDNPRTEDAGAVRRDVLAGAPDATEIGDRAKAIEAAIDHAGAGDIVLVAGKGHETGQIVGTDVLPFSDQQVVRAVINRAKVY